MRKRLACLITGVPRGYTRCFPGLRFLLSEWDVTYFAVFREEFASEDTLRGLTEEMPGIRIIVVPRAANEAALSALNLPVAATLVQMWHEVGYGAKAMGNLSRFDFIFRTRFDIFFHHQYLPEVWSSREQNVWIPEQLSWSGSNDMLCLAAPAAFMAYAGTYGNLGRILAEGILVPETILCRALALAGLTERKLEIFFILCREVLFCSHTDIQLSVLAHIHPELSVYKLGRNDDTEQKRKKYVERVHAITKLDSSFPLFVASVVGQNFYPAEIDVRDGSVFRWMAVHGQLRRALPNATDVILFTVHFYVAGWSIEHLSILIDGNLAKLEVTGHDQYGRLQVAGRIDRIHRIRPLRRPWSVISFNSRGTVVPSEIGTNPGDHRPLSVAIGDVRFAAAPLANVSGRLAKTLKLLRPRVKML